MVSHSVNSQISADLDKEPSVVKYYTTRLPQYSTGKSPFTALSDR